MVAARQAAIVAPAERRDRSTISGDHGKADRADLCGIQSPGENALDVLRRMGQRQLPRRCRLRLGKHDTGKFGDDALAQHPVLRHREPVPLRQRQDESIAVVGVHARILGRRLPRRGSCGAEAAARTILEGTVKDHT